MSRVTSMTVSQYHRREYWPKVKKGELGRWWGEEGRKEDGREQSNTRLWGKKLGEKG